MSKPKVFIGSSKEGLDIAKAVEFHLNRKCDVTVWDSGVFKPSKTTIENLEESITKYEFAVLVFTPDDIIITRNQKLGAPRDNVILELGLFVGSLSRDRTFVVCDPNQVKLPSDWSGVSVACFDWKRASIPDERRAALSPASTEIHDAILSAPRVIPRSRVETVNIGGLDELYLAICRRSGNLSAVIVLHDDTSWAWKLFPTILEWSLSGVPMTIFLTRPHGNDKEIRQEKYRRKLLKNLGANVLTRRTLPLKGFFLDAMDEANLEVLVLNEDSSGYKPVASRYEANDDVEAAKALLNTVPQSWKTTKVEFRPSIRKYPDKDVAETIIAKISQYESHGVSIKPTFVDTRNLNMISQYTRAYKYQQVKYLADRYRKARVAPFKALSISLKDGSSSIVTPPVVEDTPDGLVAIEGNTRATYCFKNGVDKFFCLLVKGVSELPPGVPWPLKEVKVAERTLAPEERMDNFDYRRFRHIERAIHPY
ncbi:MAG: TIR domain-containing protein [Planctomycetota bacterium]|jgi:hypothetical protein